MKLMFDDNDISFEQELAENAEKKYRIKGIFSSPGKLNKNGRIYPMNIWEQEVLKYQEILKSGHPNSLMELEHPPRSQVDMMEAVAKMEKLYMENGYVMGEAVLLDNPKANQLKTLIDNGIKMSVSSRGVGSVKENVVEKYGLITFDIIPNLGQSDISAEMYGIVEGVLQDKEFLITESGEIKEIVKESKDLSEINEVQDLKEDSDNQEIQTDIVETKKELSDFEKKIAQEKLLEKFNNIFNDLKTKKVLNHQDFLDESIFSTSGKDAHYLMDAAVKSIKGMINELEKTSKQDLKSAKTEAKKLADEVEKLFDKCVKQLNLK